jgi:hypothetical protein
MVQILSMYVIESYVHYDYDSLKSFHLMELENGTIVGSHAVYTSPTLHAFYS